MSIRCALVPLTLILLFSAAVTVSATPAQKPPAGLNRALEAFRAFYTKGMTEAGIPSESGMGTDWLDREIRTYLFKNVFPLWGGKN
jgi:hypothetical protein